MTTMVPRLRLFAGPNGSGKTTLKRKLVQQFGAEFTGFDLNPDDIEAVIRKDGVYDFNQYALPSDGNAVLEFFRQSPFLADKKLTREAVKLRWHDGKLDFGKVDVNSYLASVCAAYIRAQLISTGRSFALETVMSSPDKIELLQAARDSGFRTYLYFVATSDPEQSVRRVRNRVKLGGHNVAEEKIRARYERSMKLLPRAIQRSNRAYIFDNSEEQSMESNAQSQLVVEITEGREVALHADAAQAWVQQYVLDPIQTCG